MSDILEKWGQSVAERGFAQLPNYLLLLNQFLDEDNRLTPVELLVLVQLVGAWWKKDEQPFPSMGTLAVRCGVSERQIQRAVNKLETLQLIARVKRRQRGIISSNAYDLKPLVSVLEQIAKAFPNEFPRRVKRSAHQLGPTGPSNPTGPTGPQPPSAGWTGPFSGTLGSPWPKTPARSPFEQETTFTPDGVFSVPPKPPNK